MILTHENTAKAIEKAKAEKPRVRFVRFREYVVTNKSGKSYRVRFEKRGSKPCASCTCIAGQREKFVCYHVVAAVPHHLVKAAEMREAGR
ncbi:MAG TPA: SWIM zinc finger family protein [Pyrinomonadaceae bacterium]|jgi:uncharacterized Zn finger protein